MIPFSILMVQLHMIDNSTIEARVLELSPDYFTIRLDKTVSNNLDLLFIQMYFYNHNANKYTSVGLKNDHFNVEKTEESNYYDVFKVNIIDDIYVDAVHLLSNEFMNYIELKNYYDDEYLSQQLLNYSLEEEENYSCDYNAQLTKWGTMINEKYKRDSFSWMNNCNISFGINLDTPKKYNKYLIEDANAILNESFRQYNLEQHELINQHIDTIYMGNQFCIHLCPQKETIIRIFEKAKIDNLKVVMMLPPINESSLQSCIKNILLIKTWLENNNITIKIIVNDLGIYNELLGKNFPNFVVKKGIFLERTRKDPRKKYRYNRDEELQVDTADGTAWIPYYQTNTATFCTMNACIERGSRDRLTRVNECPFYCLDNHFLYPTHLDMIGQYNSLFGIDIRTLSNGDIMKEYIHNNKVECVVLNL